jgi:elongation factor 1-beta
MHELRQTHPAWNRSHKISLPQLRRNTDKTLRKMQKIWPRIQMPKMRFHRTIRNKRRIRQMGSVIITYKIFPEDIVENFDNLKKKIEKSLPEFSSVEGYGEEPVAFGLKALLVQLKFPEDKTGLLEELENKLEKIEGISQIQTLMVRRTSR